MLTSISCGGRHYDAAPAMPEAEKPRPVAESPGRRVAEEKTIEVLLTADRGGGRNVVVSLGVPFAPGVLRGVERLRLEDERGREVPAELTPLAVWPDDGSLRSVRLAFRASLEAGRSALYHLRPGAERLAPSPPDLGVNPDGPIAATLPARYYAATAVLGPQVAASDDRRFSAFEGRIEEALAGMQPPYAEVGVSCGGKAPHRTYYDGPHALYQRFARLGGAPRYREARAEAKAYRANELRELPSPRPGAPPALAHVCQKPDWRPGVLIDPTSIRRLLAQGMTDDYLLTGDPAARRAVLAMGDSVTASLPAMDGMLEKTERNFAFALFTVASAYALDPTPERRRPVDILVTRAAAWQAGGSSGAFEHDLAAADPEECARGPRGGSPFMTALLVDALMEAHALTRDPRIPPIVVRAGRWLAGPARTSDGKALRYLWGCETDAYDDSSTADLNLLIVPALGAAYALGGERELIDVGDALADVGIAALRPRTPKQWNQSMRAFGRYLGYRRGPQENDMGAPSPTSASNLPTSAPERGSP